MYHAPKPYDYNELLRRRRLAEIEKRLTEMKKPTQDKPKEKTKEPKDPIQKIAKKIIDILPDPTDKQKIDRKQNRDKMKDRLYLPVQKAKANTSELSDVEISKARIIKASTVMHDKGLLQAQESLDSNPLTKGWKIDPQLSNSDHLVVFDSEGAVKVAFRGTKWSNANDILTNATNAGQLDNLAPQNRAGSILINDILQKYGVKPSELLGYSKGGNTALNLGDFHEIQATVYNPALGPKQMKSTSKVEHTVINTVDDPISIASYFRKKDNYTIKRIRSIQGEGPLGQHKLTNFTQRGNNQPSGVEKMSYELIGKGQNLGHIETYDAMRQGVEKGKTFTETLDDFNVTEGNRQRVDVTQDGGLGERIHRNAPTVKYWLDAGGDFTPREEAHIRMQTIPKHEPLSEEAKSVGLSEGDTILASQKKIMNSSPEAREQFVKSKRAAYESSTKALTTETSVLHEHFKTAMPSVTGTTAGIVSGFAADKVIEAIDPDHKLGQVGDEATKGALSGAGTAVVLGTAVLPEAIAGGTAWVAGSESAKAITKATHSEAAGDVVGGAVGGATAVATVGAVSAVAAVGSSIAGGAELGTAMGSVVPGLGNAIGLAVGATVGAIVGGIGYLFSKIHW